MLHLAPALPQPIEPTPEALAQRERGHAEHPRHTWAARCMARARVQTGLTRARPRPVWWATVLVALLVARVRAEAAEEAAPGEMKLEVIRAAEVTPVLRGQPLQTKRTLGVRNFESTAKLDVGLEPTVEPWEEPALLKVQPAESGLLVVEVGGQEVARAQARGSWPVLLAVPPGHEPRQPLRLRFEPNRPGVPSLEEKLELATTVADVGAQAVGQTLIKGVSLVDGHLTLQGVDLQVKGRGLGLSLVRTYTNRGEQPGPWGRGWRHNYQSSITPNVGEGMPWRYLLVGGEGTGQILECERKTRQCANQRGYYGVLASMARTDSRRLISLMGTPVGGALPPWRKGEPAV